MTTNRVFILPTQKDKTQMIGEVVGTEFRKTVKASKHFLRKPPAIAIEKFVWDELSDYFVDLIRVRNIENPEEPEVYEVSYDTFNKHKFLIQRGNYHEQYALPIEWWNVFDRFGMIKREGEKEIIPRKDEEDERKIAGYVKRFHLVFGNQRHFEIASLLRKIDVEKSHKKRNRKRIAELQRQVLYHFELEFSTEEKQSS